MTFTKYDLKKDSCGKQTTLQTVYTWLTASVVLFAVFFMLLSYLSTVDVFYCIFSKEKVDLVIDVKWVNKMGVWNKKEKYRYTLTYFCVHTMHQFFIKSMINRILRSSDGVLKSQCANFMPRHVFATKTSTISQINLATWMHARYFGIHISKHIIDVRWQSTWVIMFSTAFKLFGWSLTMMNCKKLPHRASNRINGHSTALHYISFWYYTPLIHTTASFTSQFWG